MRKLALKDAFALARIIKAAGIRKEIIVFANEISNEQKEKEQELSNACFQEIETEQKIKAEQESKAKQESGLSFVEKVGFDFFLLLTEACCEERIEQKIYSLYADIKGVTPEDISVLSFAEIKNDIRELVETNDLQSFFSSLSALMSKQ